MVWFQIISISIASGIWLYYIGRKHNSHKKRLHYAIFLFFIPILASTLVINAQFEISDPDYFEIETLGLILLFLILRIEAIYVAKFTQNKIQSYNVFLYLPLFLLGLGVVSFFTMLILVAFYPGS